MMMMMVMILSKYPQMLKVLQYEAVAKMDHGNEDCLIVVVLTHGLEGGVLHAADNPYQESMLWIPFLGENCPSLAGKPKIFIIQACRGMEFDPGVTLNPKVVRDSDSSTSYRIPSHADFLIVHSTFEDYFQKLLSMEKPKEKLIFHEPSHRNPDSQPPSREKIMDIIGGLNNNKASGFVSWRDSIAGTWFIRSFCAEMRQNEEFEFLDMLTRVCHRVATDFEADEMKQMPSIYSTLTGDFIFSRKDSKRVSNEVQLPLTAPVEKSPANDSVAVKNEYFIKKITSTLEPQTSRFSINLRREYPMNSAKRGRAIIFNHGTYYFTQADERKGTEKDVEELEKVFRRLGFELIIKDNPEFYEIRTTLKKEAQRDHSDTDCLVVCVLSHGCRLDDDMIWASDVPYYVHYLWDPFKEENCSLRGKPKMFFIQACRGDGVDSGVILTKKAKYSWGSNPGKDPKKVEKDLLCHTANGSLPSDTLVFFSCSLDYGAYRHTENGTCFIQNLVVELKESYESLDLVKIVTRTSRRVALDFESDEGNKQMPVVRSTLGAKVYFRSKKEIL
ncbi:caspase-8-like [Anabrus simplex]|uniref:caspase-8-like n=1 Tax=Anabrus simplex TaxID=316456 RepID=UPI0035A3C641